MVCTRMIKVVDLFVSNTIGFMVRDRDTFKTSYSTRDMNTKILIVSRRLVCMIPGIEIDRETFTRKKMACIFILKT